jgi:hypothetical protein
VRPVFLTAPLAVPRGVAQPVPPTHSFGTLVYPSCPSVILATSNTAVSECQNGNSISHFGQLIEVLDRLIRTGFPNSGEPCTWDPPFRIAEHTLAYSLEVMRTATEEADSARNAAKCHGLGLPNDAYHFSS